MWHLCAYQGSIGNVANTQVNALTDQIFTVANNNFLFPEDLNLYFAAAVGAQISRIRLNSPRLRQVTPPLIRPVIVAATPGTNPNVSWSFMNPVPLTGLEEVTAEVTNAVAGPTQTQLFLAVGTRLQQWPAGDRFVIRATSTTAAVANAWTDLVYTLDQNLPAGRYALLFSEVQSTTGVAHRWIFDQQYYRPGLLSFTALSNRHNFEVYEGMMGLMGYFRNTTPPRLQVYAGAADAAHEIYLCVSKVPG